MTSFRSLTKALVASITLGTATLAVAAVPAQAVDTSSPVVISEVYGGGGNAGATYTNDFVELYNNSAAPVSVAGWSVQYASAAGTSYAVTVLTGTVPANGFYLVGEAQGAAGTTPLPSPDVSGTIAMSGTSGKVALVNTTTPLACAAVCAATTPVVDFVGYGTANDHAGPTAAPGLLNATSDSRTLTPFTNTGSNATDFTSGAPTPTPSGNPVDCTATPLPPTCPPPPPPPTRTIQEVQGDGFVSPLDGQTVGSVAGIVTAIRAAGSGRGFWIQDPAPDAARATASSGLFVFTGATTPTVLVGDSVLVTGKVTDFSPTVDSMSITEITPSNTVTVSAGNQLPLPLVLTPTTVPATFAPTVAGGNVQTLTTVDPANSVQEFFEAHEGMLVQVDDARVVGATNTFNELFVTTKPAELVTPRGGTYIAGYDQPPTGRLFVSAIAGTVPRANVGDVLSGPTVGPVDWSRFGGYDIAATVLGTYVDNHLTPTSAAAQADDQLAIATYNVENLAPSDPDSKYARLARGVVDNLARPDIITVEEIQDNSGATNDGVVAADQTLTKLTVAIVAAGGPSYSWSQIDPVDGQDGGQPGGNIRVVFLYNPARVTFVSKPGGDSTTAVTVSAGTDGTAELSVSPGRVDPANAAWATSRKPLAGEFVFQGKKVIVVANHFNSKGGDQSADGRFQPPTRSSEVQRTTQATVLNGFVKQVLAADPDASVVLAGDFNDYQFSAPVTTLTDDGATLTDLINTLPENERYTYVFNGTSQVLDHIFISKPLTDVEYEVIHNNSEFSDQASDHDPQVVRIRPAELQGSVAVTPTSVVQGGTVSVTLSGWDPAKALTLAFDTTPFATVTTDATGAATASFTVPTATTVGSHSISATTARSTTSSASLAVTAPPPPPVQRGVVVAFPIAAAGSPVAVVVAGWSPNIALAISLDGVTPLKTVTTDRYGRAAFNVTIPVTTTRGVHRIVATATDGTNNSAPVLVLRRR